MIDCVNLYQLPTVLGVGEVDRTLNVHMRLAQKEDAEVLERLFNEFSDCQMSRAVSIQKAISDPNAMFLVAEIDNEIVAFVHQVFFEDPFHAGTNSLITSLFVSKIHRKHGIAANMIKKAIENARTREVQEVHVSTRTDNTGAIRLYEKLGFRKEGVLLEMNP